MRFVEGHPALFIEDEKLLVVADLHIGVEYELYKSGIHVPSLAEAMKKRIKKLIRQTKAKHLIILGDVKHIVPAISYTEGREIPKLLEELSKIIKISICKGNHDGNLHLLVPNKKVKLYGTKGFRIGKYGFNHGHTWPPKAMLTCDYLIIGHTHPLIEFKDKFGYRIVEQVWVRAKINKEKLKKKYKVKTTGRLEMITFNQLLFGTPINNKKPYEQWLGPLLRGDYVDIKNSELFLLDGTYLGKMKDVD